MFLMGKPTTGAPAQGRSTLTQEAGKSFYGSLSGTCELAHKQEGFPPKQLSFPYH